MREESAPESNQYVQPHPPVSFEEFSMFFASAERVTERRIDLNRFNYSISVAVFVAIAAIVNVAGGSPSIRVFAAASVIVISSLAAIFCVFWIKQITDLKRLNNAKFEVLREMAPHVIFDSSGSASPARSYRPFDREWEILEQVEAIADLNKMQVLAASRAEYFVPQSLSVLFALLSVGSLAWLVGQWL